LKECASITNVDSKTRCDSFRTKFLPDVTELIKDFIEEEFVCYFLTQKCIVTQAEK
jgi:hypothetical protein